MKTFVLILLTIGNILLCSSQNNTILVQAKSSTNPDLTLLIQNQTVKIIESAEENSELFHSRGMLYFADQSYKKAILDFEKVIELNQSRLPDAFFYKGLANLLLGSTDCESLLKAKLLGYQAEWKNFAILCPNL